MRAVFLVITFMVTFLFGCKTAPPSCPEPAQVERWSSRPTGRTIVYNKKDFLKKPGQKVLPAASILQAIGAEKVEQLDLINGFVVETKPGVQLSMSALGKSAGWMSQPEYEHRIFQEQLYRIVPASCPNPGPGPQPNPTPTPEPGETAKSWGISRVRAIEAKALVDTSSVKICVIDTGIDLQHPMNGQVIASIGYAGAVQDRQGHGTHVAGTIAGRGGVGVSNAKLLICKGLSDSGSGSSAQLANCLTWCGNQGAQIVSNSWGSTQSDGLINNAIASLTAKGIHVFVANGNDSGPVNWPAKLSGSNPKVYAIAASTSNSQIASYSSRGPETKFIAPGSAIVSNWPGGGTRSLDGTSMATPHAAGICAYGVAKGISPCVKSSGVIGGYPFSDALTTAQ